MPGVMEFGALGQKTLPPALATASKGGAAALGFHAGAETVLPFAGTL
jgi:hypothetical protein